MMRCLSMRVLPATRAALGGIALAGYSSSPEKSAGTGGRADQLEVPETLVHDFAESMAGPAQEIDFTPHEELFERGGRGKP